MKARDLVAERITRQARLMPELDFAPLDTADLDPRDAALALAIDHAVTRRWLTLVAVIQSRLTQPWDELEAKLQSALLVGAAQLLLLDRLPDHAVINEAVQWAKENVRPKAGGLVNAVLRKVAALRVGGAPEKRGPETFSGSHERENGGKAAIFARHELPLGDGRIWVLAEPVFDADPSRRLAQQSSHPDSMITHWLATFGQDQTILLAYHDLIQAPVIVHGVHLESAAAASPLLVPHEQPGFFIFTGERKALLQFLKDQPSAIVQDPASAAPATATSALPPPPPALIIDACAGMGTKTRQLATLHPQARIFASDIDAERFDVLRRQFADHERVKVVPYPALRQFDGQTDLLLLDVPCSNTGVLARRVEAKYRFNPKSLQSVVDVQRQIIADSLLLLAPPPRGRLVYSTCSIEPAESQQQSQWITKWHPFRVLQEQTRWPGGLPGDSPASYCDGGYFAILEKTSSPDVGSA